MLSVQFSSVAQSCPTVCDPMNCRTPGLPVHHQLPEFAQTYVHWVGDAIQPSHPLSALVPPALNLSQHQGIFPMNRLFASGSQSIEVSASTSVLPMNTQDWFPLGWTGWISLQSKKTTLYYYIFPVDASMWYVINSTLKSRMLYIYSLSNTITKIIKSRI